MIRYRTDGELMIPEVICDWCGKRIEEVKDGNCEFLLDDEGENVCVGLLMNQGEVHPNPQHLYYTHKRCSHEMRLHNHPVALSWRWVPLAYMLVYLERGMKMDHKEEEAGADMYGSILTDAIGNSAEEA